MFVVLKFITVSPCDVYSWTNLRFFTWIFHLNIELSMDVCLFAFVKFKYKKNVYVDIGRIKII